MAIFMPTNQKRLTNVSIVRLRKGGKRFEVACYPNKVKSWRDNLEADIDEVLQTPTVFLNVSKGEVAKKEDLEKVFKTADQAAVCKEILKRGELQVTEKERQSNMDSLFSDVAKLISKKCINPASQRAYSVAIIEKAMRAGHVKLLQNRSAKKQATEVISALQESGELELEVTHLRVTLGVMLGDRVSRGTVQHVRKIVRQEAVEVFKDEVEEISGELVMEFLVEPGSLNDLEGQIRAETRGRYEMDVTRSSAPKTGNKSDAESSDGESVKDKDAFQMKDVEKSLPDAGDSKKEGKQRRRRNTSRGTDGGDEAETAAAAATAAKEDEKEQDEVGGKEKKRRRRRKDKKGDQPAKDAEEAAAKKVEEDDDDFDDDFGGRKRRDRKKKRGRTPKGAPTAQT